MIEKYEEWLNNPCIDNKDKTILQKMNKDEIENAFSFNLSFGTAGIRGIMGLGTNRINKYTIGLVTVGLANYINKHENNPSVVIAYDTRNNSKEFAYETALILNYYNIKTYMFKEVTSTPELSYSVKKLNCTHGIVITSSHNAKIYNGYKVYNRYGGQIVPPEDELIIKEINSVTDFKLIKKAPLNNELFNYVKNDVHKNFLLENEKAIINKNIIEKYSNQIKVTYTSLHGVGIKTATELLQKYKFNYNIVKEQCIYDGNFKTAPEPNPEFLNNYELSIKYAKQNDSDIIIATDPDADRVGVMYKDKNNNYKYINGNLLGILFMYYILNNTKLKDNNYVIRSIVTSPFVDVIASKYNIKKYEVLTGCKNIANKKRITKGNYLFGFEESLGYMFNIDINDKCGFSSMLVILEIMCYLKEKNINLEDYINDIYSEFGYALDNTLCFTYEGINSKNIINKFMDDFRKDNIKFNNINYKKKDYLKEENEIKTNALKYEFNDKSWIMLRPSGTEPKIKIYYGVMENSYSLAIEKLNNITDKINKIFK